MWYISMQETATTRKGDIKMTLTLEKNEQGKFIPITNERIKQSLKSKDGLKKRSNASQNTQSVLSTAKQSIDDTKDVRLEDVGL